MYILLLELEITCIFDNCDNLPWALKKHEADVKTTFADKITPVHNGERPFEMEFIFVNAFWFELE